MENPNSKTKRYTIVTEFETASGNFYPNIRAEIYNDYAWKFTDEELDAMPLDEFCLAHDYVVEDDYEFYSQFDCEEDGYEFIEYFHSCDDDTFAYDNSLEHTAECQAKCV